VVVDMTPRGPGLFWAASATGAKCGAAAPAQRDRLRVAYRADHRARAPAAEEKSGAAGRGTSSPISRRLCARATEPSASSSTLTSKVGRTSSFARLATSDGVAAALRGHARQVQMVYIDPPYGINYDSNFQQRWIQRRTTRRTRRRRANDQGFPGYVGLGISFVPIYLQERLFLCRETARR